MADNIAARYYVRLKDQSGEQVALFDNWLSLEYTKTINDLYGYTLKFVDDGDARFDLFEIDGQIEVYRSIPGTLDWYLEFEGFHRGVRREISSGGVETFISDGVGYNDFLARTIIAYKAGSVRADKNGAAESAMKEYVSENCTGIGDQTVVGRLNYDSDDAVFLYNAALPGLSIDTDTGAGITWSGSRAYENLLDVLKDIATLASIDFLIEGTGPATFIFKTFIDQIGSDRTEDGLDASTGLNGAGNVPVTFSVAIGNVQNIQYELDRLTEANAIVVTGKGDVSTRDTETRRNTTAIAVSPWNRREISRSAPTQDFDFQLQDFGDEVLEEAGAKESFTFLPLQQPKSLYGVHYFFGDKVTVVYGSIKRNRRITGIGVRVAGNRDTLALTLDDVITTSEEE
ncbi:hypothetical protein LCGC14_1803190 [marine sediment metagenome]|uniref:Gp28/Gp37-like domain-containing protein n=1 Tax=marine sediment metagenome TaxID=412755 RepID=A0A0F9GNU5_9ZZZZ